MALLSLLKRSGSLLKNSWYVHCREKKHIRQKTILLESKKGAELGSNIFRIAEELCKGEYEDYKIFLSINKDRMEYAKSLLSQYKIHGVKLVKCYGFSYLRLLATAGYLVTDTTLPRLFIKREGQVYLNTWHGTSFKKLGKDIPSGAYAIGNVQRNLLMADYLVSPSRYALDRLQHAHNLENLYQGCYVCAGYPRNQVFFQKERREELQRALGLSGKRIYCYMPTWRGVVAGKHTADAGRQQAEEIRGYLEKLDEGLKDSEVFFLRLHPFVGQRISCSGFRHIRLFPEGYEPYEILDLADCLVTDYSSVFFDYANRSGGKIVLFLYDRKSFQEERDYYLRPQDFPFPVTESPEELLAELHRPKDYDDREFRRKYNTCDGPEAAKNLCRFLLKGEKSEEMMIEKAHNNGKKNLLFYVGGWKDHEPAFSFADFLEDVKPAGNNCNYYMTFRPETLEKSPTLLMNQPDFVKIAPMSGGWTATYAEELAYLLYKKGKENHWVSKYLDRLYAREYERNFGVGVYEWCVCYNGCDARPVWLYKEALENTSKNLSVLFTENTV